MYFSVEAGPDGVDEEDDGQEELDGGGSHDEGEPLPGGLVVSEVVSPQHGDWVKAQVQE